MADSNEVNSQPRNSKLSVETLLPTSKSEIPIDTFSATKSVDAQAQVNSKPSVPNSSEQPRVLSLRHFAKALKEITPSSSESLGSLAELRKWNEEFGEGKQNRRRQQVWGRGRFGFVEYPRSGEKGEGKMVSSAFPRSKILEMLDQQ